MKNQLFLFFLFILNISVLFAQEMPEDWKYRQAIIIDNSKSDTELADYQIDINFNLKQLIEKNRLHPTAQDLRILDQDGQTFLCYWLENEVFASSSKIWCKIPLIKAGEKHIIYICYGNPLAQKPDYQACTFQLFEDFNASELDSEKWHLLGNGDLEINEGIAYFTGNETDVTLVSKADFKMPLIVEMKVTESEGKYLAMALMKAETLPTIWEGYAFALDQTTARMELALSQTEASQCGAFSFAPTRVKAKTAESASGIWSLSWLFRNEIMAEANGKQFLEPNAIWQIGSLKVVLGVVACDMNGKFKGRMAVDWVRIRQVATNPPTLIIGIESENPRIGYLEYFKENNG